MKKDLALKWCDALESGEYDQCSGQLRKKKVSTGEVSMCCLGVACAVAAPKSWDIEEDGWTGNRYSIETEDSPPDYITKLYDVTTSTWRFDDVPREILKKYDLSIYDSPATLNDEKNWTFKQIAALIRDAYPYM
jgi:hypothetical protein